MAAPAKDAKPVLKGARKVNFIIDEAYDLSQSEAHSILDSVSMSGDDKGLYVPEDFESSAFFIDDNSGEIVAVVRTNTVSDNVIVNAESVARALLTMVPSYQTLPDEMRDKFEKEAMTIEPFKDFVTTVDALLKSKRSVYSTDDEYIEQIIEINRYMLKNYLGDPNIEGGRINKSNSEDDFKVWLTKESGGTLDNQRHSYVYAEFIPSDGGKTIPTILDPKPIIKGKSVKALSSLGLKDDYYTVNLSQTHELAVSKNFYELSTRFARMFLNAFLGRMGSDSRNDCIAAIAGSIQVDINATILELGGGANLSPKDLLSKISATAGNTIQSAFTNAACQKTLLNKTLIAKAMAAQSNLFLKVVEAAALAHELAEYLPFVLAQTDPLVLSNKMQLYKGTVIPGWVRFQELKGSLMEEYSSGDKAKPTVETKIISSYDEIDLGLIEFKATWIVTNGNGSVTSPETPTNHEGKTTNAWTLPMEEGEYFIRADMLDGDREDMEGSPIEFRTKVKCKYSEEDIAGEYEWVIYSCTNGKAGATTMNLTFHADKRITGFGEGNVWGSHTWSYNCRTNELNADFGTGFKGEYKDGIVTGIRYDRDCWELRKK
ncbi:hypothetical protein GCM10023188_27440 [Pontibacter saemangeumensis]|uniref:Uncharacterized protein n=2 Tax=Pontibacter saemangeumensis TaxID=1084525 RepID=A0ABP8LS63_9BACT